MSRRRFLLRAARVRTARHASWTRERSVPAWLDAAAPGRGAPAGGRHGDDFAWRRLAELTDTFGHRLSGSDNLRACDALGCRDDEGRRPGERADGTGHGAALGARARERRDRRSAAARDRDSRPRRHRCDAAGRDRSRSPAGDELRRPARPTEPKPAAASSSSTSPFTNYTDTVAYRTGGARAAAQYGAVAVLGAVGRSDRAADARTRAA